jgi:hypothetical protein
MTERAADIIILDQEPEAGPAIPPKKTRKKKVVTSPEAGPSDPSPARDLFPHQLETVELMEAAERSPELLDKDTGFTYHRSYGHLTNPVGSGKTSTVLQLIKNDRLTFETVERITLMTNCQDLTGNPQPMFHDPQTKKPRDPSLRYQLYPLNVSIVVCSKTLTTVWKAEARIMGVTCVVFDTPKQTIFENFVELITPLLSVKNGLIVISSHVYGNVMSSIFQVLDMRRLYTSGLKGSYICFKRLILDDIHSVPKWCTSGEKLCPLFTWSINSTPNFIQWSKVLYYLADKYLTMTINGQNDIKTNGHVIHVKVPEILFTDPEIQVHRHHYRRNDINHLLKDYIPPHVQNMLETGDFDGAYQAMLRHSHGDEAEIPDGSQPVAVRQPLHELVLNKYYHEIRVLEERRERLMQNGFETANVENSIEFHRHKIEVLQERLRAAESETTECPICMDEIERRELVTTKCCFNSFCRDCIMNGCLRTNKTCPLCRKKITHMDLYSLKEDGTAIDMDLTKLKEKPVVSKLPPTPMDVLLQLVLSKPTGKFVVFAPYQGSSETFRRFFKEAQVSFEDIMGMAVTVERRLERFRNGDIRILFLSSRSSNAGLNLQFATDVVIVDAQEQIDPSSPQYTQSIGRVRRFPRTDPVPVHFISPEALNQI